MSGKEYREKLRAEGRCTRCTKFSPGKRVCNECREKNKVRMQKYNEARASGKCSRCGAAILVGFSLCLSCKEASKFDPERAKEREKARRKRELGEREVRRQKGLCLYCEEPRLPDRPCCKAHVDYFEKRRRERYEAGLCDWCDESRTSETQLCVKHLEKSRAYKRGRGRFFSARSKAKSRGVHFDLSRERYEALVASKCHYCKISDVPPFGVGLDQVVPGEGYTDENAVPCCEECNAAKSDYFTPDEMRTLIGPAIREAKLARAHAEALAIEAERGDYTDAEREAADAARKGGP